MVKRITFAILLIAAFGGHAQNADPVVKGKLDLRTWKAEQGIVSLEGEWLFTWNALLQWDEIDPRKAALISFSRPWNEQLVNKAELPGTGFATYAAQILLPSWADSLALEVPAVYNAHELWVNDNLVCANGKVGTSETEMTPEWRPLTVKLKDIGDTLRIVFHVSNFHTSRGGPASAMRLGTIDELMNATDAYKLSARSLIIFFVALALLFFIFFVLSPNHIMLLYFSGLALTFGIRFLFSDYYPYYDFGIRLPWLLAARIEYISVPLMTTLGILFICSIYPLDFNRRVRVAFLVINLILIFFICLAPPSILSELLLLIQICTFAFLIYVIFAVSRALIYERPGAWLTAVGIVIFALAGIYNLFAIFYFMELNRIIIHSAYTLAMIMNALSLLYRTPIRIRQEEQNILRYSDLYNPENEFKP